jgi:hypothetical protein
MLIGSFIVLINPLPVQFKSLQPGQEGCVFFSGHLNVHKYHYILVRLGQQRVNMGIFMLSAVIAYDVLNIKCFTKAK